MAPKPPSLVDWASEQAAARLADRCWLCRIPERAEVEEAIRSGRVTASQAVRWLKQVKGYAEATENRVRPHMANHVGRPGPS